MDLQTKENIEQAQQSANLLLSTIRDLYSSACKDTAPGARFLEITVLPMIEQVADLDRKLKLIVSVMGK